jgi:hypothetical protein
MKRFLDSQGGAFDKDATKPALKTVWFLVDPLFSFIFCVEYLFYLQILSMLLSRCPLYRKKIYIYFFFASESRSSKPKSVFHCWFLTLLRSHSKRQHVDSFCAELFSGTVPCPIGLAVSVLSKVSFCLLLVSSIQVWLP